MTRAAITSGMRLAYADPSGLTTIVEVLYARTATARVLVDGRSKDVEIKWLSDLTPQEQARLAGVRS
jgi:hypothetical protein